MAKKNRKRARKGTRSTKAKGMKRTPSRKRAGAGRRAMAQSRGGRRKTAGARTPKGKAARKSRRPALQGGRAGSSRRASKRRMARGGSGEESTLAQTPETGRTRSGPTNPMPTRRSTGTPAGAGSTRHAPGLERERRRLREVDETVPSPPSSLDPDRRTPSAARTGRREMQESLREHHETGPALTAGDVDADWEDAYSVGDEAPGGDNPTPDQDRVDDIGKALGVEYQDNEPLKASDKVAERDRHRWELDPASSEDYRERE